MKLIIDTDPGVDDALAIAIAVAHPDIDLLGITAIFGNTFTAQASRNARYLLDLFGHDCPVAEGAALPFGAEDFLPSSYVHGEEGLGHITTVPQIGKNSDIPAAVFLCEMARKHKGELVICAIGPLTNIADAITLDPDFARNLKQLVVMGGAFEAPGNITAFAEANIYNDAAAADIVFSSGMNTTMVGLNATMLTLLTPDDFTDMAIFSRRVGSFLRDIHKFYLNFYASVGITDGCPMHDATALLACVAPERFEWIETGIRVTQEGDARGDTVASKTRPPISVALSVDAAWAVQEAKRIVATYD